MRLSLDRDDAGFNERLGRMAGVRLNGELVPRALTADEEAGEVVMRTSDRAPAGAVALSIARGRVSIVLPIVVVCASISTAQQYMAVEHGMRDPRRVRYVMRADGLRGFAGRVLDVRYVRAPAISQDEHRRFDEMLRRDCLVAITPAQLVEQVEAGYHGEA